MGSRLDAPLTSLDISEWLGFVTLVLLITSEIAAHFGPSHGLLIDRTRLRIVAVTTGILLFALIAFRAVGIVG